MVLSCQGKSRHVAPCNLIPLRCMLHVPTHFLFGYTHDAANCSVSVIAAIPQFTNLPILENVTPLSTITKKTGICQVA